MTRRELIQALLDMDDDGDMNDEVHLHVEMRGVGLTLTVELDVTRVRNPWRRMVFVEAITPKPGVKVL